MAPKFVFVMRHAEKCDDKTLSLDLSPGGQRRAEKLASYIPATFGAPNFIFAAANSNHSARPFDTVKPLAASIGVPINATISDHDYEVLAHELLNNQCYVNAKVLVCWHHGNIPSLMHALGAKSGEYPDPWDRNVFNLILKLDYSSSGTPSLAKINEPF